MISAKFKPSRDRWSRLPDSQLSVSLGFLPDDLQAITRALSTCRNWEMKDNCDLIFEQALK